MPGPPAPERFSAPLFVCRKGHEGPWGVAVNMSSTGILLESQQRPPVDSEHTIFIIWDTDEYVCRVRVVRHLDTGFAVQFLQPEKEFLAVVNEIVADSPLAAVRHPSYAQRYSKDPPPS